MANYDFVCKKCGKTKIIKMTVAEYCEKQPKPKCCEEEMERIFISVNIASNGHGGMKWQ